MCSIDMSSVWFSCHGLLGNPVCGPARQHGRGPDLRSNKILGRMLLGKVYQSLIEKTETWTVWFFLRLWHLIGSQTLRVQVSIVFATTIWVCFAFLIACWPEIGVETMTRWCSLMVKHCGTLQYSSNLCLRLLFLMPFTFLSLEP